MQAELQALFVDQIPTMKQVFDFIVAKILAQGRPSQKNYSCVYRGENNLRCAAGWVLPDEDYDPSINGAAISSDFFQYTVTAHWLKRGSPYYRLIRALQADHDEASLTTEFIKNFVNLADITKSNYVETTNDG